MGPLLQFLKDPLELIRRGKAAKGECFSANIGGKNMVFLVGPKAQEFFCTMDKYFDQAKMYKFTIPVFGPKVLYDVGYTTRTCQLNFVRDRLTPDCFRAYAGTLQEEIEQYFAEEWPGDEGVVDIRASMIECLSRMAVRCLMGHELRRLLHHGGKGETVAELLHDLEMGMLPLSVFMPSAPVPRHRRRDWARRKLGEFLKPVLAARRKEQAEEKDFLAKVLKSSYPDGTPVTDEEIVGLIIAAFFGGMHNSSITTSWSTLEIFSRPALVKELVQEQREALKGGDFTIEGYEAMSKLRSAVTEVLRMHPPLMLLMRTVEQDVKFKQYRISQGSVVVMSPNVGGMLPEVFPNPETFDPTRFADGVQDEFAYIPFGGGRRICKGKEFGFLQVMAVLSHLLRNYDLECVDGVTKPTVGEGMVIAPSQPCRVHYKKRREQKN